MGASPVWERYSAARAARSVESGRGRTMRSALPSESGFSRPSPAGDLPPAVVGVADDEAFGADPDMLALERVAERDMRDLLRQADRQADMGAEHRVTQRRVARRRKGRRVQRAMFAGSNS